MQTLERPKVVIAPRIASVLLRAWRQGDGSQVMAVQLADGTFGVTVGGALGGERYPDRQAAMLAASRMAWG